MDVAHVLTQMMPSYPKRMESKLKVLVSLMSQTRVLDAMEHKVKSRVKQEDLGGFSCPYEFTKTTPWQRKCRIEWRSANLRTQTFGATIMARLSHLI